jgi:alanyl-tRNA synthetase
MLGNWSFGDYFKREAIRWAWELLVDVYGLPADRFRATVFGGDEALGLPADKEAQDLWPEETGISKERVLHFGRKDNFWEMGETGPCGPCSEIHFDLGPEACDRKDTKGHTCGVNGGCARFIEIWNLVFIQYNQMEDGRLLELPAKHVDNHSGKSFQL